MTILAYDYVLMLRHEIQFVWRSADWRLGKCLYLATRYLGFVSNILAITGNFHHGLSVHACAVIETSADWTLLAEIGIAQVILYIRTYAIWGQSRSIKYLLISTFLTIFIAGCMGYKFTALQYFPTTLKMVPACDSSGRATGIAVDYGLVCLSELVVVALTIWRCAQYELKDMSSLLFVLYRDGLLFFLCLFGISSFNIVSALLWNDLSMLQCVMHSVLTSRVILHLHIAAAGEDGNQQATISLPVFEGASRRRNDDVLTSSLQSMPVPIQSLAVLDTGFESSLRELYAAESRSQIGGEA